MSNDVLVEKDGIQLKNAEGAKRKKRKKRKRVTLKERLNFCVHMRAEATSNQVCNLFVHHDVA